MKYLHKGHCRFHVGTYYETVSLKLLVKYVEICGRFNSTHILFMLRCFQKAIKNCGDKTDVQGFCLFLYCTN